MGFLRRIKVFTPLPLFFYYDVFSRLFLPHLYNFLRLFNTYHSFELFRRYRGQGVSFYAVHPGVTDTPIWTKGTLCLNFSPSTHSCIMTLPRIRKTSLLYESSILLSCHGKSSSLKQKSQSYFKSGAMDLADSRTRGMFDHELPCGLLSQSRPACKG